MDIEMAGCAAIWPEQGLMRVVVLSVDGLDPSEQSEQHVAVRRMARVGHRGVLYDARQVEELEHRNGREIYNSARWNDWGRVALIVRSEWTAVLKNFGFRWLAKTKNVRVFKDTDAAKKWLVRTHWNTSPH